MCWYSCTTPIRQIAAEDKPVTKIMFKDLNSAYRFFKYEVGIVYSIPKIEIRIDPNNPGIYEIGEGFHSYSNENTSIISDNDTIIIRDNEGNLLDHFFVEIERIVKCIIPKGASFYENERGEIVSDRIIVK